MKISNTRGFTLVEIMIVVVIIGLMAAMAIPSFIKMRENSVSKAMQNDARHIMAATQQYLLANPGTTSVDIHTDTATGAVVGPLAPYVKKISKGTLASGTISMDNVLLMSNPQFRNGDIVSFDFEGKMM